MKDGKPAYTFNFLGLARYTVAAPQVTIVYFGPTKPEGVSDGNWIQTDPAKGWNMLLRL